MTGTNSIRRTPEWLRPLWESKSAETAARIFTGMEMLLKQKRPVTLADIQQAILAQSSVRVSRSTIQRSEAYRRHRRSATRRRSTSELGTVLNDFVAEDRRRMLARASRLRRENKEGIGKCGLSPIRGGASASTRDSSASI
jgi:hypothetical protein